MRLPRVKVATLRLPAFGILYIMGSVRRGQVATLIVSRTGSVSTSLHTNGQPQRVKHWTAARDHRKRMERWGNR